MTLDPTQLRVLGSLIEKEITTPENYPLSLNALLSACNQRSSRDPVLDLTEEEVRQALHSLEDLALVTPVRDARVPKYEHRIRTVLNLRRDETAALCLLMLRAPHTPAPPREPGPPPRPPKPAIRPAPLPPSSLASLVLVRPAMPIFSAHR